MKALRTAGIILAVALVAIGVALLPSADDTPAAQPGIVVGGASAASDAGGDVLAGGDAVSLPSVSDGGADGAHPDSGSAGMEYEAPASPEPPATTPAPTTPAPPTSSSARDGSATDDGSGAHAPEAPQHVRVGRRRRLGMRRRR